jgi:phosphomannomutase
MSDMAKASARVKELSERYREGHTYFLDGFSVEYPDWHFNVRESNTEPILRLNLEATTREMMEAKRDEVLAIIRA